MDTATYLSQLERELGGLAPADRQNTLAYYEEFLSDASSAGQMDAEALLGTPHTLAAQIRADIAMEGLEGHGAGFASGYEWGRTGSAGAPPAGNFAGTGMPPQPPQAGTPPQNTTPKSGIGVIWAVIVGILAIPVGIPLAAALFALIVAVVVSLFAVLFSLCVTALALFATGLLAFVAGFALLFSDFATGLFYMGTGLVVLALFVLLGMGCWQLGKLCVKGVAKLFNAIRKRLAKRERTA
ncbi:MAG: hypothetical protein LBU31_02605 [Coriobacteriales bacterium]|nr:hypothetical protein [Coriobacteriales bacterium]